MAMSNSICDQFVNNVIKLTETPGKLEELCDYAIKSIESLSKMPENTLQATMDTLNPAAYSIGYVTVLTVKYQMMYLIVKNAPQENHQLSVTELIQHTDLFLHQANPEQLRIAINIVSELVLCMTTTLKMCQMAAAGINTLILFIQTLRAHPQQLTQIDYQLCYLCLLANNYKPALPVLDADIFDIYKVGKTFDSKPFLLYYYYGGLIYTALRLHFRAVFFFEVAVFTPASCVSDIMLEAYKKYLLVYLIAFESEPPQSHAFLSNHSYFGRSATKNLAKEYTEIVNAFSCCSSGQLQQVVQTNTRVYTEDCNMGLVKQCVRALYKKNIKRLTKTFLTLSLADVVQRVQLSSTEEAEKLLREMIEDGKVYATVHRRDGMVQFHDNPERYNQPKTLTNLDKQSAMVMQLNNLMSDMERKIQVTPQYLSKMANSEEEANSSKSGTGMNSVLPK